MVLQQVSFVIPIILLLCQKRSPQFLPRERLFAMPEAVAWAANLVAVAFCLITIVFFCFPHYLPTTASSMSR